MPESAAALIMRHLYSGSVYRPDGKAVAALAGYMQDKHGLSPDEVAKGLEWCQARGLVAYESTPQGITRISATGKYHPPRN